MNRRNFFLSLIALPFAKLFGKSQSQSSEDAQTINQVRSQLDLGPMQEPESIIAPIVYGERKTGNIRTITSTCLEEIPGGYSEIAHIAQPHYCFSWLELEPQHYQETHSRIVISYTARDTWQRCCIYGGKNLHDSVMSWSSDAEDKIDFGQISGEQYHYNLNPNEPLPHLRKPGISTGIGMNFWPMANQCD